MLVFPDPVGPTSATVSPGSTLKLMFLSIGSLGRYPNVTFLNSTDPLL